MVNDFNFRQIPGVLPMLDFKNDGLHTNGFQSLKTGFSHRSREPDSGFRIAENQSEKHLGKLILESNKVN